ncbi:DAZ-associated protein 2 [Musca vetustissima]|uniref:DAZ-associated protein 2 n=1 Tax=Musca vetustissima TaxID=27455 RepID=UPI002AB745D5|nr:DAZ-associated protein 2 [Musca vetustissima]
MSKSEGKTSNIYPTAPPETVMGNDNFQRGPPPPSYDEALRMSTAPASTYQPAQYYQPQQQPYQFPSQQAMTYAPPTASGPSSSYGYVNPYPAHMQQHQNYYNATPPPTTNVVGRMSPSHNVLEFHKRAEIRTTATGAITVPPPPPGCAPTPAQLAAMSGQPVMIKKKKNSFF